MDVSKSQRRLSGPRMPKAKASTYTDGPARSSRRNCDCGNCPICEDNQRWERIFREKFADPTYYLRTVRRDSPLRGY
jgi:hypothetical protein